MATDVRTVMIPTPMSWDEYVALDQPGEYIDGVFHPMNPPTKRHQILVRRLANVLEAALGDGVEVVPGWGWKPSASEFVPDVLVTPVTDEDARFTATPLLAVEVLSTNLSHDTSLEFRKYEAEGLPRYWIVDPDGPVVDVFELDDGAYSLVSRIGPGDDVTVTVDDAPVRLRPGELAG